MEEVICIDTSILLEYFRKTKKGNSFFYQLIEKNLVFTVSVITEFEIYCGSTDQQVEFWDKLFKNIKVIPLDQKVNREALKIYKDLKKRSKLIEMPDIFIAATAKAHNLKLATNNKKHFERIKGLELM